MLFKRLRGLTIAVVAFELSVPHSLAAVDDPVLLPNLIQQVLSSVEDGGRYDAFLQRSVGRAYDVRQLSWDVAFCTGRIVLSAAFGRPLKRHLPISNQET